MPAHSALAALILLDKKMRDFGFEWDTYEPIINQIKQEIQEVEQALHQKESSSRIQEEIGDLLHASISLLLFLGQDVHETLVTTEKKLSHRFEYLQKIAHQQGYTTLKGQPRTVLQSIWDIAKEHDDI